MGIDCAMKLVRLVRDQNLILYSSVGLFCLWKMFKRSQLMTIMKIKWGQIQNPPELCVCYESGHVASFLNPLKNAPTIILILEWSRSHNFKQHEKIWQHFFSVIMVRCGRFAVILIGLLILLWHTHFPSPSIFFHPLSVKCVILYMFARATRGCVSS